MGRGKRKRFEGKEEGRGERGVEMREGGRGERRGYMTFESNLREP